MNPSRPDVVFDCNVFLQAITRVNGPAAQALRIVERNLVTLHVSRAVLQELRRALAYPEIRQKNPHVTDDVIDSFLTRVSFRAVFSRDVKRAFEFSRDPSDEPYLNLCAAISADYLVTRDKDLLDLATDHSVESKQIRQRLPNLSILNPLEFITEIRRTLPDAAWIE